MPTESQKTSDGASVWIKRANSFYDYHQDHAQLTRFSSRFHDSVADGFQGGEAYPGKSNGKGSIRDASNPDHIAEDLAHLHMKHPDCNYPILDPASFALGYQESDHAVEFVVRDPDGHLKQRIHTTNIRTNVGGDWQGKHLFARDSYGGGSGNTIEPRYLVGTATGTTAGTTTPSSGNSTAYVTAPGSLTSGTVASLTADQFAGQILVADNATTLVYGVILTHTSGTTPVFNVDRWRSLSDNGTSPNFAQEATATVPSATSRYMVVPGMSPALYIALSTDNTTNVSGTVQSGSSQSSAAWTTSELVFSSTGTSDSGLGRVMSTNFFSQLASAGSGTVTTANTGIYQLKYQYTTGAKTGGSTVWRAGVWNSNMPATVATYGSKPGNILIFDALLTASAVLQQNDTLAVTWSITF